ncbi:MAG: DinB family protein [Gemmatimonadota bacterium]|nr:MAG: DinB family protein [Gemmatimonadota bacterium]
MTDARIKEIVTALEPPKGKGLWHGGASPLGSLRGVTAEQAAWKPAPNRHSIWELVLHIAYWKYAVRRRLTGVEKGGFPRAPANWPAVPKKSDSKAWSEDRALLRDEHAQLVETLRSLDPARLDRKPVGGGKWTCADLMMGVVLHDTYHTGQIQLLKRLYAAR